MTLVDYASNFWGDKHIGYSVLYENMKKGEDTVQEFMYFLKERVGMEDEALKSLGKSLHRVNSYIANNGALVDAWRLAKGTLELWTEIQTTLLRNLNELVREVQRYQEELARMRKRAKDTDTLETINLMQTTTTCLQKARETYNQRCAEVVGLKHANKEWTPASTKEYLKARNKLSKAHEEYRIYTDKYTQLRDLFEERIVRAARQFQEHDRLHLLQMKRFFAQMAKHVEDGHSAQAQVSMDWRQNVELHFDVEEVMLRFIDEKGTGTEPPQKLRWTEADELPPELDVGSCIQSQSSSNSSAIVPHPNAPTVAPTVNDLLGLDEDTWMTGSSGTGGLFSGSGGATILAGGGNLSSEPKSGDSDSERGGQLELFNTANVAAHSSSASSGGTTAAASSSMPQQISSWISRQKLGHWRLRKHSASQSSLPTSGGCTEGILVASENVGGAAAGNQTSGMGNNFSKSCNEPPTSKAPSLLKRYQKNKGIKSSVGDLTQVGQRCSQEHFFGAEEMPQQKVRNPLQEFGPPPPLPNTEPPPLLDGELAHPFEGTFGRSKDSSELGSLGGCVSQKMPTRTTRHHSVSFAYGDQESGGERRRSWSSSSNSSGEEEAMLAAQRSKIRQLQIRPLDDVSQAGPKMNASVDELRSAIEQISLQKSSTFADDPWSAGSGAVPTGGMAPFSHSHGGVPIRATLTGDAHIRRKYNDPLLSELPFGEFSHSSTSVFATGATASSIARARPRRSHTPLVPSGGTTLPAAFGQQKQSDAGGVPLPVGTRPLSVIAQSGMADFLASSFGTASPMPGAPGSFAFNNSFSSSNSPLTVVLPNSTNKIPIAMAINEYLHAWIKRADASPRSTEIRLFGAVLLSLPSNSLPLLQSADTEALKFSLLGAAQLTSIVPNKQLIDATPNGLGSPEFCVTRERMADFLKERVQANPQAQFHNADLLRYEIQPNLLPTALPLAFSAKWTQLDAEQTEVRVEYKLDSDDDKMVRSNGTMQGVCFSTKVEGVGICLAHAAQGPAPKWQADQGILSWELGELCVAKGTEAGSLRAVLKHAEGTKLTPANTFAQFQVPDALVSSAHILLDDGGQFCMNVFRRKLISGKYFTEPRM